MIGFCDSVIQAGESKYGSHVAQFEKIKKNLQLPPK